MALKRRRRLRGARGGFRRRALRLLAALALACDGAAPEDGGGASPATKAGEAPDVPPALAEAHPVRSPNAWVDMHLLFVDEAAQTPHPGDGGGRLRLARLVPIDRRGGAANVLEFPENDDAPVPTLVASSSHRFEFVYEVGEEGIADGGRLFFEPEPFWDWSPAQTSTDRLDGYLTARPRAADVRLVALGSGGAFAVEGRALVAGEKIDVVYGAGARGARVDRYAQRGAEFLVAVDADGDGFRAWVARTPRFDIAAHGAERVLAFGPAEIAPGQRFEVTVSAVDRLGNRAAWPAPGAGGRLAESFAFEVLPASTSTFGSERAAPVAAPEATSPMAPIRFAFEAPTTPGTLRLRLRGLGPFADVRADVPPIRIRYAPSRLYWADLHGHSGLSDGTGLPEDYFRYARDVARLDAAALTDHDHWGVRPLDRHPEFLERIREQVAAFHAPGRFVTLPGYEWTSWLHGHRHVLWFDPTEHAIEMYSSIDPATDRPDELWKALEGSLALTFAHHSAGEPIATNWFYPPDPVLEPVTEIASVHGMSEAEDAPAPVAGAIRGAFVRDELMRGVHLGFIGSGDSHDGHPGLAQLAASGGQSGLAGLFAERLDRPGLLAALRARRSFATNGIRPWFEVRIDDQLMGSVLAAREADEGPQRLRIRYEATAPIEAIDLIRSGVVARLAGEGRLSLDVEREIPALRPGEFHYVRIRQSDGGVAWSSPIFAPSTSTTDVGGHAQR